MQILSHADGADEPYQGYPPPGVATSPYDVSHLINDTRLHVVDDGVPWGTAEGVYRHQDNPTVSAVAQAGWGKLVL